MPVLLSAWLGRLASLLRQQSWTEVVVWLSLIGLEDSKSCGCGGIEVLGGEISWIHNHHQEWNEEIGRLLKKYGKKRRLLEAVRGDQKHRPTRPPRLQREWASKFLIPFLKSL